MANRKTLFWICAVGGFLTLLMGLLTPAHLRAVDVGIIQRAGRSGTTLTERGIELANGRNLGAAQLLLEEARRLNVPDREKFSAAIGILAAQHPDWEAWGGDLEVKGLFTWPSGQPETPSQPFTEFVIRLDNRIRAIEHLQFSTQPSLQKLINCRALTNTAILPPAQSSSGQVFDAALAICGLLLERGKFSPALSNAVLTYATQAHAGQSSEPLEEVMVDIMSLGQRMNWDQLGVFVGRIGSVQSLHELTRIVRQNENRFPLIFSATQLSGKPDAVAKYLTTFSKTGLGDLEGSLRSGAGGMNELLARNQRLYDSNIRARVANDPLLGTIQKLLLDYCWRMPNFALILKWLLYLGSGFLLAMAVHFVLPVVSVLERPLQVRGFHLAREVLFALGFVMVVLLLSEPFLSQDSQRAEMPFKLRLPTVGAAVSQNPGAQKTLMDQSVFLMILLFFVIQALLYVASLVKLAEIRRQRVGPRMKVKLLENEEHLFDSGLYVGFLGTIVSFVLASAGVLKTTSLMAAYSSTSFGILFVVLFKVVNLRPVRRRLLLEAEAAPAEQQQVPVNRPRNLATAP